MAVLIALLRAVNVGGRNLLPMEPLRTALTAAGFGHVRTYVQSGNIVLRSDKPALATASAIAEVILGGWGFSPPVLVLSPDEIEAAVNGNPFAAEPGDKVHVFFMGRELPRATADFLQSVAAQGERYSYRGSLLWLHLPDGLARSKLAHRVMNLPIDVTARNMKTVSAIMALALKEVAR